MKNVFTNKQLAHVWNSESQGSGRNANGSMYFEGATIYSYGSHFPIATIYHKGSKRFILVNEAGYSNTTAKQKRDVLNAISYKDYVMVPQPTELGSTQNENYLYNDVISSIMDGMNTRVHYYNIESLTDRIKDLNTYLSYIGKKEFVLDPLILDTLKEIDTERQAKEVTRRAQQTEKQRIRAEEYEKARVSLKEEIRGDIDLWLDGQAVTVLRWDLFRDEFPNDLIRIKPGSPDIIETNRGAEVPLDHAMRLLNLVLKREAKTGEQVGHFKVDLVNEDTLEIGCHTISIQQAKSVLMPNRPNLSIVG